MISCHYNLGSLWEQVVSSYASNVALKCQGDYWTYSKVDQVANKIAKWLLNAGISVGDVVAIVNTKKPESYAAMIACLKIGAPYTNVDKNNPLERTALVLNQCKPRIILMDDEMPGPFINMAKDLSINANYLCEIVCHYESELSINLPEIAITGARIAYIMYTSGSTGIPKGAAITHQNVINFIAWTTKRYEVKENDVFANISPMFFDNSVFDFYTALFSGASIAPLKKELIETPKELVNLVDNLECTIWFSVPSALIYLMTMRVLSKDTFKAMRIISFGGEGYPKSELIKLYDLYKERVKLINVYGPTEGTCICSSYDINSDTFLNMNELPSIGNINPNFDYLIIDSEGCSRNEGELCILGPNIGLGYYKDEKRTNEVFSTYSEYGHYKTAMYKTGDLVFEKDKLLYFRGRKDNQIKHMGYRIELEEIEIAITNCSNDIEQVAVIYERVNSAFGKILAFVSSRKAFTEVRLKESLSQVIPEYMIPSAIKILPELPKNANGKVDKIALRKHFMDGL